MSGACCQSARVAAAALRVVLAVWALPYAHAYAAEPVDADAVVRELRGLPAELYPGPMTGLCHPVPPPCPPPPLPPAEAKRQHVYDELYALASAGVSALARGLSSSDASVRSNAALALLVLSEGLSGHDRAKIDISPALPGLINALQDSDLRTRALAAQAIGDIGPGAAPAVPALIKMLTSADEGQRNSACIGLRGIGHAARDALPALEHALADPSPDVRSFAQAAIASIRCPSELCH